jgi:uncharacterized YigZ family protein
MNEVKQEFPPYKPYKIVSRPGCGEIVEKKSRFIANIMPVGSEEEAAAFIDAMRKKYYDARHNCPAFIIGPGRELTRCSDDGEPSGTAGKPILEVLLSRELTNVAVVVTRYFGGTLLGTGGLVRAYTEAVKAGLANTETAVMRYGTCLCMGTDYTDLGKIQYILGNRNIPVTESEYTVRLFARVAEEHLESLCRELTESTGARISLEIIEKGYYKEDLQ